MSNGSKDGTPPFPEDTEAGATPEGVAPDAAAEPGAAVEAAPDDALARLAREAAEAKDKLLRALAETENVRRRAAREREDTAKYAIANFAREMLTVADNLRRALDAVDAEALRKDEALAALVEGVTLTERSMLAALGRVGIRPIEALGRRFDHNLHEAMFEIEDKGVPAGAVAQVLEPGYLLHDRLLRPAKVAVAKGGPPAEGAGEAGAAEGEGEAAAEAPGTPEVAPDAGSEAGAATPKAGAYEKRGKGGPGSTFDTEL